MHGSKVGPSGRHRTQLQMQPSRRRTFSMISIIPNKIWTQITPWFTQSQDDWMCIAPLPNAPLASHDWMSIMQEDHTVYCHAWEHQGMQGCTCKCTTLCTLRWKQSSALQTELDCLVQQGLLLFCAQFVQSSCGKALFPIPCMTERQGQSIPALDFTTLKMAKTLGLSTIPVGLERKDCPLCTWSLIHLQSQQYYWLFPVRSQCIQQDCYNFHTLWDQQWGLAYTVRWHTWTHQRWAASFHLASAGSYCDLMCEGTKNCWNNWAWPPEGHILERGTAGMACSLESVRYELVDMTVAAAAVEPWPPSMVGHCLPHVNSRPAEERTKWIKYQDAQMQNGHGHGCDNWGNFFWTWSCSCTQCWQMLKPLLISLYIILPEWYFNLFWSFL